MRQMHAIVHFNVFFYFQPSPTCSSPEVASSTAESAEHQRIWLWQQLATHVTPSVQRIVEFAKRVPGKLNFITSFEDIEKMDSKNV